jgi:hypothetical protein
MLIHLRTVVVSGVFVVIWFSGCVPLIKWKDPIRINEARFMDSGSGATISEVLLVQSFTVYTGIATGHASGDMAESARLEEVRVQRSGEPLTLKGGSVFGIWWAFVAVTGRYSNPGPVLVVAPGYRLGSVKYPWAERAFEPLVLEPLLPLEAIAELEQIHRLLDMDSLSPDDAARLGIRSDQPVTIQLTRSDQETIRAFVSGGLADLHAKTR